MLFIVTVTQKIHKILFDDDFDNSNEHVVSTSRYTPDSRPGVPIL